MNQILKSFIFSIDGFFVIFMIIIFLYICFTKRGKKFKFNGLDADLSPLFSKIKKKKRLKNKSEERCRQIFQKIFNKPFKKIRPDWLKNPATGKNLELDGFCPNIITKLGRGLAFEYDGCQHSKMTPFFHRTQKDFIYQRRKDDWKTLKCRERRIELIRIPYFVVYHDLERYIILRLKKLGIV